MNSLCTISENVGYRGYITIELRNKGNTVKRSVVHNGGTPFLLTSIAKALCGNSISEAIPSKIDWWCTSGTNLQVIHDPITVSGLKYTSATDTSPALIETQVLIKTNDVATNFNNLNTQFQLKSKSGDTLATVDLTQTTSSSVYTDIVTQGYDCLIKWTLEISNITQ